MRLQTSIQKLDELTGGGIEIAKAILFSSQPGIDEASFAQQLLFYRLQKGDHCLYLVNNKLPKLVKARLKDFDWDVEKYAKKGIFAFFDCYSGFMGLPSEEKFSSPMNLKEVWKGLFEALKKFKNKNTILIIDSLSTFIDLFNPDELLSYVQDLIKKSKELNVTPVFLFTEWPYDEKIKLKIKGMFDCIVELKAVEKTIYLRNYFTISKIDWLQELNKSEIPFKIMQPGGIKVYIPKILVTGPYNAGKSSFVHSASTKAVSVERIGLDDKGTTIALDHGHVDYKGFTADLFGTPGQERFDPLLRMLGEESIGAVIVLDSTAPETFERAKEMIQKTNTQGLPAVIVANKANLKGALKPDMIRKKIGLSKDIPIIPVVAESLKEIKNGMSNKHICRLKKEDVDNVLNTLFNKVI